MIRLRVFLSRDNAFNIQFITSAYYYLDQYHYNIIICRL